MSVEAIEAAARTARREGSQRVSVVTGSVVESAMVRRTLAVQNAAALGPAGAGVAGVDVLRWVDLAHRIVLVLSDSPAATATTDEVIRWGVRAALEERAGSLAPWLELSLPHPPSWRRLAQALMTASMDVAAVDDDLPVSQLQELAGAVEENLARRELLLPGRLLTRAADLVAGSVSDRPDRVRAATGVVVPWSPVDPDADGAALHRLSRALEQAGVVMEESPLPPPLPRGQRRVVLAPNAYAEARVVADQVAQWLLEASSGEATSHAYDDVAVITPRSAPYQAAVLQALKDREVKAWTTLPVTATAGRRASRVVQALARALDRLPGCSQCAEPADPAGHDCSGQFADVAELVSLVMPVRGHRPTADTILGPARELVLTEGLGNWQTLLKWLCGDDGALPGVTARNADPTAEARDRVARLADTPDRFADLAGFLDALAIALAPRDAGTPVTAAELADRLDVLADASRQPTGDDAADPHRTRRQSIRGLRSLAHRLRELGSAPAIRFSDIADAVTGSRAREGSGPGSGVAIVTVDDLTAVTARRVAWCGMAEGLCPPVSDADPLVDGHDRRVQAARVRTATAAADLQDTVGDLLVTCPRSRIGARTQEVASAWLLSWTGLDRVGAADALELTADQARQIDLSAGWQLDVVETSLQSMADLPTTAELQAPTTDEGSGPARRYRDRVAAWNDEQPGPADGLLGPHPAGSWLAARRNPDKDLSPSRVKDFVGCPRKFFLSTIVGLRTDEDPDPARPIPPSTWGSCVHAAVEGTWSALRDTSEDTERHRVLANAIRDLLPAYLPFVDINDPDVHDRINAQAVAVVTVCTEALNRDTAPVTERHVSGVIEGLPVGGYIDFAWPDLVADLKTGGLDTQKPSYRENQGQVGLYAQLVHDTTPQAQRTPVASQLWYAPAAAQKKPAVDPGPTVPPALDDPEPVHVAQARSLAEALDVGAFPAVGDPLSPFNTTCQFCDFTAICDPDADTRWAVIAADPAMAAAHPQSRSATGSAASAPPADEPISPAVSAAPAAE